MITKAPQPEKPMPGQVRFGPFALNLETADLEAQGRTYRLPEQQFQILSMLISKNGSVASREDIRRTLWPNDTIVEFDRSINTAILKLRSALREISGSDSWIETIPRRGYRLNIPASPPVADVVVSHLASQPKSSQHPRGDLIGQTVSHYRVLEVLGGGGMGVVYKGEDLKLDRPVALKFIAEEPSHRTSLLNRLEREARTASSLNHPNICTIYQIGEHNQQPFIVMEFLEGETLRELIDRLLAAREYRQPNFPLQKLLDYSIQMARGLAAAHAREIIHRDIKPANVFVTTAGIVKLLDFGVARQSSPVAISQAQSPDGEGRRRFGSDGTSGTVDYMSPEQASGAPIDKRSDLFSFGVLLAELFTGAHPFRKAPGTQIESADLEESPRLSGELPESLLVLIRRLLSRSLELRYQSITEVLADLERVSQILMERERSNVSSQIPLIGREQEFARLKEMLSAAISGRGSLIMIGGEPGIGKSHLAAALIEEARQRGALGISGHCSDMEGTPPYAPFIEMLEYITRMVPRESFRYSLGDQASEVARLMPELREMYPEIPPAIQLPPEQERRYLFNAFRAFVQRAASVTPLAIVFEDVHWADETTLLLLQHHAQTLSSASMLVICTYRDTELDVKRPFARTLETLLRTKLCTRMPLHRLPSGGVKDMLTALSGQQPPPPLVSAIYQETDGNPFFVEEVFRHLSEEGMLLDEDGKWRTDLRLDKLQVPESVRLVLGRRFARLTDSTRRVLTTAAVIGRSFSLRLLEQLENREPDGAIEALEEAEDARLVAAEPEGRDPRYRFVHELVRQTLAESLSMPRRQRLHFRIAEAIEKVYSDRLDSQANQLAHHLYQAGAAADLEKTSRYLLLAARQARAKTGHEEALEHLELALSLREDHADRSAAELLVEKASTLRSLGRPDEAVATYRKAIDTFEAIGEFEKLAETSIDLAYLQAWRHDTKGANQTMERAHQCVLNQTPQVISRVLSMRAAIMSAAGEPAAADLMFEKARALCVSTAPSVHGTHELLEAIHSYQSFQLQKVRTACPRVATECFSRGDLWSACSVEFYGIWAEMYCGSPESGFAMIPAARERAEKIGHHGAIWALKIAESIHSAARGNLETARDQTIEAWEFGAAHDVGWNFVTSLQRGHFALWSGNIEEAEELYHHGIDSKERSYVSDFAEACLFAAWAQTGNPKAASAWKSRKWHLPAAGQINSLGTWNALERTVVGLAYLKRSEDLANLRQLTDELLLTGAWTYSILFPFETVAGITAAAAGDWHAAEAHHVAAIQQVDTAPYRHLQSVAREWYARMLIQRHRGADKEQAKSLLEQCIRICESLGQPHQCEHTCQILEEL